MSSPLEQLVESAWQTAFDRLNNNQPDISGLLHYARCWDLAFEYIKPRNKRILDETEESTRFDMAQVELAFQEIRRAKTEAMLWEAFREELVQARRHLDLEVQRYVKDWEMTKNIGEFRNLFHKLGSWYVCWWTPLDKFGLSKSFPLHFQTVLFSTITPSFIPPFTALIASTLESSTSSTHAPHLTSNSTLFARLSHLGFISKFESLISSVVQKEIDKKIHKTCPRMWNEAKLAELRTWCGEKIGNWCMGIYAPGSSNKEAQTMVGSVMMRYEFYVFKTLCDLRISEIFDIIVDHPDSVPALNDLQECVARVDSRQQLVQTLRRLNNKRLLHPGADTKDILTHYVLTIRCLRIIDPPGVLLFKVADPIRRYLRDRPDTVRCIVAGLVGDSAELIDESEPAMPLQQFVEDYSDMHWQPDPVDAGPEFRASRPGDVISTLVSIYDSKDLFVKELQVLLAQRLTSITDGNFEKEIRNIEILKLRFGEAALQVCEVMLKDMSDSRRTEQHIQNQEASVLHPTIISRLFWPPLPSTSFIMPGQLQKIQKAYEKQYNAFKPAKRLRWLPSLGSLSLEIELKDRTLDVDATPLEAAIIELISVETSEKIWTLEDIRKSLGFDLSYKTILSALMRWAEHGILKDENGDGQKWVVLETSASGSSMPTAGPSSRLLGLEELPPPNAATSLEDQETEKVKVYWQFIKGMLTNVGALSLDRIQGMLKYAQGYDRTLEQLAAFLEAARVQGMVETRDGLWRLVK